MSMLTDRSISSSVSTPTNSRTPRRSLIASARCTRCSRLKPTLPATSGCSMRRASIAGSGCGRWKGPAVTAPVSRPRCPRRVNRSSEVNDPDVPKHRPSGKSDPIDAVRAAAREVLARGHQDRAPPTRNREAIRVLLATRNGAVLRADQSVEPSPRARGDRTRGAPAHDSPDPRLANSRAGAPRCGSGPA